MLLDHIPENFIEFVDGVKDYKEAITLAGNILKRNNIVEANYISKMIEVASNEKYIVIAPHIAMPHARPEDGALKNGMSLLYLREPVNFGHPKHDPVKVVFALAGKDNTSHLDLLSELCERLDDVNFVNNLLKIKSKEEIIKLFSK